MENRDQMIQTRDEICLSAVTHHTTQTHESTEDFLLPDYMPAIRRVITVQATTLPESRFLTGKAMEFAGTLAYSVLYIGEGGEIFCAPLTSEYSGSAVLAEDAVTDAASVGMDTTVESVTCRVTAPRRFTLKCRMKTVITALQSRPICEKMQESAGGRITAADEIAMERLTAEADDTCIARGELTATASGTLNVSGKVISCSGAVRVEEAIASQGAVAVRGDVILSAIILSQDGKYSVVNAKSPFTETVTVPAAQAGDCARAWGRAAAVSVTTAEEGGTWEIEFDLEAESVHAEKRTYTADLFSTDCAAAIETAETDSLRLLKCGQGAVTVSGEAGRQSKAVSGETVLDAHALCSAERLECRDGKLILHGTCAFTALILADGDITVEEFSLPLKYECDASDECDGGDILWRCAVETVSAAVRSEGDKLAAHADVSISLCALSRGKIRYVDTVTLTKSARRKADDGCIRICYPDAGEPLWDLAKRYGVARQTIRVENGIPESETTCDGTPILI